MYSRNRPNKRIRPESRRDLTSTLFKRQTTKRGRADFNRFAQQTKFNKMKWNQYLDPYDSDTSHLKLCFLKKRTRIVEIVSAKGLVFGLNQTGVCAAFDLETKSRVCFLNIKPDEVIRSLFYNKANNSLITVSVYRADNFSSLRCRSTPIASIMNGKPEQGFPLFESESLRWPGFVEFDDVNGKVLTYSAAHKIYKVWDLTSYEELYSIKDYNIQEIKISPGIMLLISMRSANGNYIPLQILDINTGDVIKSFKHSLHPGKKVDFIEQFNEKLLVKQENEALEIIDVKTSKSHIVPNTDFMTPSAFIFLYENQLFLTFRDHHVAVWNFKGELMTEFEDHVLWHPDCNTNNIYITAHQDCIISFCQTTSGEGKTATTHGSLNVSHILSGKCLAKIQPEIFKKPEMMNDVTALYYNEERNEIYTGSKSGLVHVWSN